MTRAARRVWLTGASAGIGLASAHAFASSGDSLAICARGADRLSAAQEALLAAGAAGMVATVADISTREGVEAFGAAALAGLGGCDVLIHNVAGGGPGGVFERSDDDFERDWGYAVALNLLAPARLVRLAADALRAARGVVVHISSAGAQQPEPFIAASYGATKAGLDHLTRALARELGPAGVRVVGVAPGATWTETWEASLQRDAAQRGTDPESLRAALRAEAGKPTDLGRPATPTEIANAVHWLASPAASYITGVTLRVDGGFVRGV